MSSWMWMHRRLPQRGLLLCPVAVRARARLHFPLVLVALSAEEAEASVRRLAETSGTVTETGRPDRAILSGTAIAHC